MSLIRTGDIILCSSNNTASFCIRTFTSSIYNHAGIAIRVITNPLNGKFQKISLNDDGELCVLEISLNKRVDQITNNTVKGIGVSTLLSLKNKYDIMAFRSLRDEYRTDDLLLSTMNFMNFSRGKVFPNEILPFLEIWLGISISEEHPLADKNKIFCSEMVVYYYLHCVATQYLKIRKTSFNGSLTDIFGNECPLYPHLYSPGQYVYQFTYDSPVFGGKETIFYHRPVNILKVLIPPILITGIIIIFIILTLRYHR